MCAFSVSVLIVLKARQGSLGFDLDTSLGLGRTAVIVMDSGDGESRAGRALCATRHVQALVHFVCAGVVFQTSCAPRIPRAFQRSNSFVPLVKWLFSVPLKSSSSRRRTRKLTLKITSALYCHKMCRKKPVHSAGRLACRTQVSSVDYILTHSIFLVSFQQIAMETSNVSARRPSCASSLRKRDGLRGGFT